MTEQNQPEQAKPRHRKRKILAGVLIGLAVVLLLLFFGIPLFLSSGGGKDFIVGKINQSVDGKVQMDDLSIGWFKGVKIQNMSFDDNAGNTSVQVKRLETQPQLGALLGGRVKLGKTVIENPVVYLKVSPEEMEKEPREPREPKEPGQRAEIPLDQIDLQVIDGKATIEMTGPEPQKISFTNIASSIVVSDAARASTMAVSMQVQDGQQPGTIEAKGQMDADKKNWTIKDGQFNVKISKLQLASLKPLFALAGQDMDMAGELNADADAVLKDNKLASANANAVITNFAQGAGKQRTVFTEPVTLTAQAAQEGETLRIDKLNVKSGFVTLDTTGTLNNLKYDIQADLAQTQKFAGQFTDLGGLGMQGAVAINGTVSMNDDAITVTSKGGAQKLVLTKEGVKTPMTDAQINFEGAYLRQKQELRVANADVTSTPATIKVSNLAMPLGEQQGPKTISMDARATADLAQAWPFVQVFAKTPEGLNIAGKMDAGVKITTTGNQVRLLTEDAAISQLRITQPDSEPFAQDKVSLKADVLLDTQDKTIDIKTLNLQGAQGQQLIEVTKGTMDRSISQNNTTLKGDFEAVYDLKALTSFAAAFMPQGLTMEGQRKAFFKFESSYPTDKPDLMMANLNGSGNVGFNAANFMGLKFGATDLNVNIQKGLMKFDLPDAKVNEGILRMAGEINMAAEKKALVLTKPMKVLENIHLDDELTRNLLVYLNPMFAKQTNVTGIASLECRKLSIPLDSPMDKKAVLMDATVAMNNVNLKAQGFLGLLSAVMDNRSSWVAELKPTQILMDKGILQYRDMEFILEQYPIGFTGKMMLAQSEPMADLNIAIPYNASGKTVHVGEDLASRINVPYKGPISGEALNLSEVLKSVLRQGVEQQIQEQIQKGLQDIFK